MDYPDRRKLLATVASFLRVLSISLAVKAGGKKQKNNPVSMSPLAIFKTKISWAALLHLGHFSPPSDAPSARAPKDAAVAPLGFLPGVLKARVWFSQLALVSGHVWWAPNVHRQPHFGLVWVFP